MKTLLQYSASIGAASLLLACGPGLAVPADGDVTRGRQAQASLTLEELNRGRASYIAKCSGCHHLYAPSVLDAEGWADMVSEMRERSNLTHTDERAILTYLTVMSRRPGGS